MSEFICPECGAEWPSDLEMEYCGKCRTELTVSAPKITDKERRTLTVLFADISGFTAFSEQRDPETVERLIDTLLTELGDVVDSYDGYVDKYMGDAIMAIFGAPVAHEDDSLRAVRTGVEMLSVVDRFNDEHGEDLSLSVGINHGKVLWSQVGGGDYTVMGDTVNVAQRLEDAAAADTILISEAVQQQTDSGVRYSRQSPLEVTGRERPVQPYVVERVVAAGNAETRLRSQLCGRDGELEQLIARYEEPVARFLAVTGEAGIGKSRLIGEFRQWLADQPDETTVVAGRCSQHVDVPLEPFGEYLLSTADTGRGAPDAGQRVVSVIDEQLADSDFDRTRRENIAHLLAMSVGLDVPDARVADLDPEQLQRAIHDAWATWLRERARDSPVVVQIEDLHWADEATRRLLGSLQERLTDTTDRTTPITVIATYRPHSAVQVAFEKVVLEPLETADVRAVAESLLEAPVDEAVVAFLTDQTGGNPYFLEEVIRYLLDNDMLVDTADGYGLAAGTGGTANVPETLNGLLTGRIDALPHAASETLKGGAVIGERFWRDVLAATLEEDIGQPVETLAGLELIQPRGESTLPDDDEYAFRHALLRDAAYELLLKKTRRELHRRVATALEDALGTEDNPLVGRIAHHYDQAGEYETAFEYYRQAGDVASQNYANETAVDAYQQALTLADEHDVTTDEGAASVAADLAGVFNTIGEPENARDVVETGLTTAPPESTVRCRLLSEKHSLLEMQSQYDEAVAVANQQRELARKLGLQSHEADAINSIGDINRQRGNYADANQYYQRSLDSYEESGDRNGQSHSLKNLGGIALRRGNYETAEQYFQRSLDIQEASGDRHGQALSLNNLGIVGLWRGNYETAEQYFQRSLNIKVEIGNRNGQALSLNNLGAVAFYRGNYETAEQYYQRSLDIEEEIGDRYAQSRSLYNLGKVARERGNYETAEQYLQRSLEMREAVGNRQGQAISLTNLGIVAADRGNYETAEQYCQRSLDICEDIGDQRRKLQSLNQLASIARRRQRHDTARNHLDRVEDSVTDIDDIEVQINYHRERAALSRTRAKYDHATSQIEQARTACEETDSLSQTIRVLLEQSRVALARGQTEQARETLTEALDALDGVETPLYEGRALVIHGALAAQNGNSSAASDRWTAALSLFDAIGARPDVLDTLQRLSDLACDDDHTEQARTWCRQAQEHLGDAPGALAERHSEWITDRADTLNSTDAD